MGERTEAEILEWLVLVEESEEIVMTFSGVDKRGQGG